MTTKAEDVRKMAEDYKQDCENTKLCESMIREYADLLDQQEKGEPVGYVYKEPDCAPCFEYVADRWTKHGAVLWTEMPVYTHPSPDRAEPMK
jgi:hypothetical protein